MAEDAKTQHMLLQQAIAYATKANLANLLGPVIKVRKEDPPPKDKKIKVPSRACMLSYLVLRITVH